MKALFSLLFIGLIISCKHSESNATEEVSQQKEIDSVKRGEYLVNILGCHDCHSPKIFTENGPVPNSERLLSGHPAELPLADIPKAALKDWVLFNMNNTAVVGPWGISYAANLTSDDTGTGLWSFEQFKTALTKGKFKGMENGRSLLPPMPWPGYVNMEDADVRAIYDYLKSTKPIRNIVPDHQTPGDIQSK